MIISRLQKRSILFLAAVAAAIVMLGAGPKIGLAQQADIPQVPVLTLTGSSGGWDAEWYPDGRIWMPPSEAGDDLAREFLMPVFIDNRWHSFENTPWYQADPIYSFKFSIQYDKRAVRPLGVQKFGPRDAELDYDPLAKYFNLSWYDEADLSYKQYQFPGQDDYENDDGRAITIVGTSTKPLPVTDDFNPGVQNFKILCYVRFRVVPTESGGVGLAGKQPLVIARDTIQYNDLNVRTERPFEELIPYQVDGTIRGNVLEDYPLPTAGDNTGLAGVDNELYTQEPLLEGMIFMWISNGIPDLDMECETTEDPNNLIRDPEDPALWHLVEPITVDSAWYRGLPFGDRVVQLFNIENTSRLLDLTIESDQKWLKFQTLAGPNRKTPNPITSLTRYGWINWLDNNTIGNAAIDDPLQTGSLQPEGDVFLNIRCDANELDRSDGNNQIEATGMYTGYITFRSSYMQVSPVRLKVTFLHFRDPLEKSARAQNEFGIEIKVRNSKPDDPDEATLIFGTGYRATDGVDSLFGERAFDNVPQGNFFARWFPMDSEGNIVEGLENGLDDWSPSFINPRSDSRDIRSSLDTNKSILYYCRFEAGDESYYPIVIEWDTSAFPAGSQLFLRDSVNGSYFSVNMRRATPLGNGRFSYTIQDARFTSFIIEYTLPRVIEYVDDNGDPIIKQGWNLLSLPIRPSDPYWNIVYQYAINQPYYFSQNQYDTEESGLLKVGRGYFIKFANQVDRTFSGSYIYEISPTSGDPIMLYPGDDEEGGWNTIGCVSSRVRVEDIEFENFGGERPNLDYVLKYGVWKYETGRGYKEVSELQPGLGYWLKVDNQGYLSLTASGIRGTDMDYDNEKDAIISASDEISISDAEGNIGELYMTSEAGVNETYFEMPPTPPLPLFDVRFRTGRNLGVDNEEIVMLQGVDYPVEFTVDNPEADYQFVDALTGKILGTISAGSNGKVVVEESAMNAVKIQRSEVDAPEFGISIYPNPVADIATIDYSVETEQNVVIEIYDAQGNFVGSIDEGSVNAGAHTASLNVAAYASGKYFAKIQSGEKTIATSFTVVR